MTSNTGNTVDLISDPVSSGPTGCATLTDITAFNCATPLLLNKHGIAWLSGHTAKMATVQQQVGVLSNLCSGVCGWQKKGQEKKMKKGKSRLLGEYEGGGWCRAIHIVLQIVLAMRSVTNSSCATPLNHKYPNILYVGVELG